mmetsp:Transcript_40264/g.84561  ORF Transcript_40264/g.84561 Transcript_40264/m.84561 type:complete len:212 (+) Transcript_40264:1863-2498(+)
MLRVHSILLKLIQPKHIVLQILGILAIDGIQFPAGGAFREERTAEEGSESQERLREATVDASVHFEVVDRLFAVGEGVVGATIRAQKFVERILIGKFVRPQKQHVFAKMRQSGNFHRIRTGAHVHVHGHGGGGGGGIGHEEDRETVGQRVRFVGAEVEGWFEDADRSGIGFGCCGGGDGGVGDGCCGRCGRGGFGDGIGSHGSEGCRCQER